MLSDKKLSKIEKILGAEIMGVMESASVEGLKDFIVKAEFSIKEAISERDANPKYQEIKESLKALSSGLSEVKKHQNAAIQYALSLLEDKGV